MVISGMDMKPEKLKQFIGLLFLELWKGSHESVVDIQGPETCDGMGANCWMMGIDWWSVGANLPGVEDCIVCES